MSIRRRAVDDVVVEEGRGVDELDRGGKLVVPSPGVAEQACAGEGEHWPHPLAASGDEMAGKLRDERDLALHPFEDDRIDAVHSVGDEFHQRVERRLRTGMEWVDAGGHCGALAPQRGFS